MDTLNSGRFGQTENSITKNAKKRKTVKFRQRRIHCLK
jgi:hypothetical protein